MGELVGKSFSGEVRIPKALGPDLDTGDPDRGFYVVPAAESYFAFDGFGTKHDVDGGMDVAVWVQDCNFDASCPPKDNFVWFLATNPANGIQYVLLLSGTIDPPGPGPQSEGLPDIELLQAIADYGGNFEVDTSGFTEVVLTYSYNPSEMSISVSEIASVFEAPNRAAGVISIINGLLFDSESSE